MNAEVERFFEQDVAALIEEFRTLESEVDREAVPGPGDTLDRLTQAITRTLDACAAVEALLGEDSPQLKEVQERFRDAIRPWFDQSWFMERARSKPRGYPGDYVLLSAIYDNVPKSRGLGGLLDLYFLDQTLAHGVRTRLAGVRRFLTKEVLRRHSALSILNVACGPAREYAEGFASEGHPVHLTCVDMDEQALAFVQDNVAGKPDVEVDFECVCYNALRMASSKSTIAKFGRSDVIYSVGLCDYIPDDFMIRILRGWRESLAEGGVIYVAFKDRLLYNKAVYQWLVDWHFYQRTEEDCRRLYEEAGYDVDGLEVERDGDGVIMNFIARLEATPIRSTPVGRLGQPESAPTVRGGHLNSTGHFQQVHR
ncbi:MAG: class I SAM-dependent methyltransferase [Planctomycetaceae bacterium]|nr:class I SAM-dependent methyltransferase [Planctomycetaceae bacterium]